MSAGVLTSQWKELHLPQLQVELDGTASEIATRQDASEGSRKVLVEASKDFKKTASEEVRKTVAPLLKLFQGEVDVLSKRSKASEAAFLSLYRKIVSLPDPLPALDNAAAWQKKAQKAADLEMEVSNLRTTLKQYSEEFAEVKNQEVTIRQLREKLKSYEETADSTIEERVAEREAGLRSVAEERERAMEEASAAVSLKLAAAEGEVGRLEANLGAARDELFRLRSRVEDKSEASSAQLELIQVDAERAHQRAEVAERQLAALQAQLDADDPTPLSSAPEAQGGEEELLATLRAQLSAKDAQLSAQIAELTRLRTEAEEERRTAGLTQQELQENLQVLKSKLAEANRSLHSMSDYEDVKSQLATMMTMEFGSVGTEQKSLEVLLLEKNKALQSELTSLKLAHHKLQGGDGCTQSANPGDEESASLQVSVKAEVDEESELGTPASSTTTPGPLQPLVDTFGALLGAEMAANFARPQPELERIRHALFGFHPNNSPIPPDLAPAQLMRQLHDLSAAAAAHTPEPQDEALNPPPLSPPPTLRTPKTEEPVEAALARLHLTDVEVQVKDGMPRYLAEQMVNEQLQKLISENMGKLGDAALNTGQVASHCRTLLSMYNLGQRLFAKSILNQSQGSLSELLSKPRPWQRLTEKGREAFRKMFAWVSDERAITLLRSLSPRRAYVGLTSGATSHTLTTSLLGDAGQDDERAQSVERSLSSSNRWRHDDIPKEMVQEIYQRELAKLKEQENSISQQVKAKSLVSPARPESQQSNGYGHSPNLPQLTPGSKDSPSANGSLNLLSLFPERQHRQRGLLRAVLPQITQEQFEEFAHLNTEDLVRQVKDFLSQHSISQRLFGEHVLGLSQGSVSDLLARPKPWHMLTQKGREPFIRMQLFLCDPDAVEQLRSRKSQRGASTNLDHRHSPLTASPSLLPKQDLSALLDSISQATHQNSPARTTALPSRALSTASSEGVDSSSSSTDMDTTTIADHVRRLLHENSIGQKLFGEAVLGVSQGTVSELLSKPKPWGSLSLRGREPYIRMHSWLQDPLRIEKLQQYMMLTKSGRGMKRGVSGGGNELSEVLSSLFSAQPAVKKARSLITEQQKEALKFAYEHEPYPSSKTVEFLAKELALSIPTVTNWFHNHRMRVKNAGTAASDGQLSVAHTLGSPLSSSHSSPRPRPSPSPQPLLIQEAEDHQPPSAQPNTWKKGLMDLIDLLGDDDGLHSSSPQALNTNAILQDA